MTEGFPHRQGLGIDAAGIDKELGLVIGWLQVNLVASKSDPIFKAGLLDLVLVAFNIVSNWLICLSSPSRPT